MNDSTEKWLQRVEQEKYDPTEIWEEGRKKRKPFGCRKESTLCLQKSIDDYKHMIGVHFRHNQSCEINRILDEMHTKLVEYAEGLCDDSGGEDIRDFVRTRLMDVHLKICDTC